MVAFGAVALARGGAVRGVLRVDVCVWEAPASAVVSHGDSADGVGVVLSSGDHVAVEAFTRPIATVAGRAC
jgi:hypothetical protein